MHGREFAVLADAGSEFHQYRMTAAVTIEYFFPGQRYFHRSPQQHSRFGYDDFVIERIGLAAKPATLWTGDDSDAGSGQLECLGHRTMYVVWTLRAGPQRYLSIRLNRGDGCMLL